MPTISELFTAHLETVHALRAQEADIARVGGLLIERLAAGGRVFLCGNGGSAADAQHIAAELVCRFETARRGLPAIALTTDSSALTAIGNDFGFERVFARQVEALARPGDVLIAISTSGDSANVIAAARAARAAGVTCVGLLGGGGGRLRALVDDAVLAPSSVTARVQECHILIGHIWCALIDEAFAGAATAAPPSPAPGR
jgi:phosphoheptose isomerase